MKKGLLKKIASIVVLALIAVNTLVFSYDVQATSVDAGQKVVYQQYLNVEDVKTYFGKTAPTYQAAEDVQDDYGYLFGGWFTKHTIEGVTKFKVIKTEAELDAATAAGTGYYAKFVPSYVLSVKCLNKFGTAADTTKTNMRFVSAVDSTNYAYFGFQIAGVVVDEDGNLEKVGKSQKLELKDDEKIFYKKWAIYSDETTKTDYKPNVVLGSVAKYYMTSQLINISNGNFFRTYSIQPFWKTYDGVEVYGLTKYAHVEDGIYNYINVPVNLKNSTSVAAGIVEFDWTDLYNSGYTFKGAECGKTFKVQKTKSKVDGENQIVRCVAMVDVANGATDVVSNDIFMNLRFEPKDNTVEPKPFNGKFYHFGVNGEEFSNIVETKFVEETYDVWNIQY